MPSINEKISIVICAKDAALTISRTFDSLLSQTSGIESYRLIIVNDGSTDETNDIIRSYLPMFCEAHYIDRKENKGVVYSMNEGIKAVETDWYMRLDPDDTLVSEALETLLKYTQVGSDLIVSHRFHCSDDTHEEIMRVCDSIFSWVGCGVLINTAKAKKIGLYRQVFWEEFDFYIRFLSDDRCSYEIIDKPLYRYFINDGSITSKEQDRKKGFRVLEELHGLDVMQQYGFSGEDYLR